MSHNPMGLHGLLQGYWLKSKIKINILHLLANRLIVNNYQMFLKILMFIFVLTRRYKIKMYVRDTVMVVSNVLTSRPF
jgi:hypothetical protein